MPHHIQGLLQEYQQGHITRREFMAKAAAITGSLAVANSLFESVAVVSAYGAQVDPNDPDLTATQIEYPGKTGMVFAYVSRPKAAGKYPAIVVIHENRGVNDHIRDIARRLAKEGYVALAPDFLSRHGPVP